MKSKTTHCTTKTAGVYSKEMVRYVEDKRIEINSIVEALNDNSRFWEWIIQKLCDHLLAEITSVQWIFRSM
jgi:hypothetical protein